MVHVSGSTTLDAVDHTWVPKVATIAIARLAGTERKRRATLKLATAKAAINKAARIEERSNSRSASYAPSGLTGRKPNQLAVITKGTERIALPGGAYL